MHQHPWAIFAIILTCISASFAADNPNGDPEIISPEARLEMLWDEGEFTEGVAVGPDGSIYFSDIARSIDVKGRILRFDPKTGKTTVFSSDSRKSNGLMFDRNGQLYACCGSNGGAMALCKVSADGVVSPVVERFEGKRLNSPNDLVIHPNGSIYFSDPRYIGPEQTDMDQMSVYRYDPKTGDIERVTTESEIQKPNGVHVSPNGRRLYVAETNNGSRDVTKPGATPGRMTLNAFTIKPDGSLANKRVLADFGNETGTDGMAIDVKGNIYAAVRTKSRPGVRVINDAGRELAYIPTDELPTNCCFGRGKELSTLYITIGGGLYRIGVMNDGFHSSAGQEQR